MPTSAGIARSINARFGNQTAVLMGDWLYMSAFETSAEGTLTGDTRYSHPAHPQNDRRRADTAYVIGSIDITEEEYFDILAAKDGLSVFGAVARSGRILAGAGPEQQAALRDYGMNLGIAFQLADDLFDFTATDKQTRKGAGADLVEGKLTLPLILLCRRAIRNLRKNFNKSLQTVHTTMVPGQSLWRKLEAAKILEEIRVIALGYADAARKNLEVLPKTKYSLALGEIPNFVIDRKN